MSPVHRNLRNRVAIAALAAVLTGISAGGQAAQTTITIQAGATAAKSPPCGRE